MGSCEHMLTCVIVSGQIAGWKLPKFHVVVHVPRVILMYGCLEVTMPSSLWLIVCFPNFSTSVHWCALLWAERKHELRRTCSRRSGQRSWTNNESQRRLAEDYPQRSSPKGWSLSVDKDNFLFVLICAHLSQCDGFSEFFCCFLFSEIWDKDDVMNEVQSDDEQEEGGIRVAGLL